MRKFVFYPKKRRQFHRLNLHIPFIDCLLLLFNIFYHRSDREIPTAAAFTAVLNRSREWPCGQVGPKQLFTAISRKVVGKNVHATIPKGNMGYNQYTVPGIVAVEPSFVVFF